MAGAENIDPETNAVMASLMYSFGPGSADYTFAFVPAGEDVEKGGYTGGDDLTRAWTAAEQTAFTDVAARFSQVADVSLTEVSYESGADIELQIVDSVPGGWAGYAQPGGSTYVVGSTREQLLTHELGHSLFLAHPHDGTTLPGVTGPYEAGEHDLNSLYNTVMSYNYGSAFAEDRDPLVRPAPESLAAIDIAVLQALYGANDTFAGGDDVYGPQQDEFDTIWDSGGLDAIDFSSAKGASQVDLRPASLEVESGGGGFTSAYEITPGAATGQSNAESAYTIAYGVTIENGYAGAGADRLIGNAADNHLAAGLGDDTVEGGSGDDHLEGSSADESIADVPLARLNDGAADDRSLEIDNFAMPSDVTMDMVVKFDAGVTHAQHILSYTPDNASEPRLELRLWDDSTPFLYFISESAGGGLTAEPTNINTASLQDGEVHRLTLTRDAASGEMRFFLDGEFRESVEYRAGEELTSGGKLVFGQNTGVWQLPGDPMTLEGQMGPIAIHDRVLSDTEIAQASPDDLVDPDTPGLVSEWMPDPGTGTVPDETGGTGLQPVNITDFQVEALNSDDDSMTGGEGSDMMFGREGADTLLGDQDDDTLAGGAGGDDMTGGNGTDMLSYAGDDTGVTVRLYNGTASGGHAAGDSFSGFENLEGGSADDYLTG
ncbi:LamG-like jellyroll fold domain-containing protein, partial [Roseovarius sp. SYSU LYC5161]|uniref:LamG-like jellyroll fold domain-containing protein n=1 Tax=Roseovarius halophilus (ex Wu et al. 2025) TaxID=3376060 RepID=UPI00399B3DA4